MIYRHLLENKLATKDQNVGKTSKENDTMLNIVYECMIFKHKHIADNNKRIISN